MKASGLSGPHFRSVENCDKKWKSKTSQLTPAGWQRGAVLPLLVETLVLQIRPLSVAPLEAVGTAVSCHLRPVVHLSAFAGQTWGRGGLAGKL